MRQKIFSLSFIYSGQLSNIVYLWGVFRQGNDYQMSVRDLLYSMNRDTKPSLKSLDYTNPQSEKFCTNGGNKRPLLPPREVVDQQRSLQSRTCNIVCEVTKVPRETSQQLKPFSHWLMLMFMGPPSGEHWSTMLCMAELEKENHCSLKRKLLAKDHVDKPEDYWRKI